LAYQNTAVAGTYDQARFRSFSGRLGDRKEKLALCRALDSTNGVLTAADAACGTGRMTQILLDHGLAVTGVDISLEMMDQARAKLAGHKGQLRFTRASLFDLPFDPASFDLANCSRLFGHYNTADRRKLLGELARVSKKWVIVQYFHESPLTKFKRFIKRGLRMYQGVVHPIDEATLREELQSAGLREVNRFWCRRYYSEEVFVLAVKQDA
jgi:ubiquinone/menaquinone biosynthesis C-methylase UbiE